MTVLLLYPYWVVTVSSRKIKLACCEYLPVREITGDQQPDHSRNSDFRRRNREGLKILFVQILRLCRKAGLVIVGEVVLGGIKVKCNASKHKALTHEWMLRSEKQLAQEINALMSKAKILDDQEDRRFGKDKRGSDLPNELSRRQDRLERITQACEEMERRRPRLQRVNGERRLIRPEPRLMPPKGGCTTSRAGETKQQS